ncbi:unnamed protein product [Pleuronectes platessa]|uniref:Glycerol-3-phosphate dehydrogenase [NAD(+)] n=1 Tax=Pleuronectes platessa TaxID=8262 RepID=A0A9N7VH65_PLEPL|nr:unnamed protein product [Pleuronectes platessa]
MAAPKKVCVIGSGNWGSAIAKIVGANAAQYDQFDTTVNMWVFEETVNGRKLTEIINTDHENVKYLPGHKLPPNVLGVPELVDSVKGADILIFVVPHQFIVRVCDTIKDHIKKDAVGMSLIKGIDASPEGLKLISEVIRGKLGITMAVLMGANIANEVAEEKFCETTIGCKDKTYGSMLKELMQTTNFRVTVVEESDVVEICGALKNIVAVGAVLLHGLPRLPLPPSWRAAASLTSSPPATGGRNRKIGEAFARTGKSIEQLENELLNGQKLQGPATAMEVHEILKQKNMVDKFPLFAAVYQICFNGHPVAEFIQCLQNHPEHK